MIVAYFVGLGTGSVLVTVQDENDVAPRFPASKWEVALRETTSLNSSLALISVVDPDLSNNFTFKVSSADGDFSVIQLFAGFASFNK